MIWISVRLQCPTEPNSHAKCSIFGCIHKAKILMTHNCDGSSPRTMDNPAAPRAVLPGRGRGIGYSTRQQCAAAGKKGNLCMKNHHFPRISIWGGDVWGHRAFARLQTVSRMYREGDGHFRSNSATLRKGREIQFRIAMGPVRMSTSHNWHGPLGAVQHVALKCGTSFNTCKRCGIIVSHMGPKLPKTGPVSMFVKHHDDHRRGYIQRAK
jgi:hypothetical protein